jgi:hypothetical protein
LRQCQQRQRQQLEPRAQLRSRGHAALLLSLRQQRGAGGRGRERARMAIPQLREPGFKPCEQCGMAAKQTAAASELEPQQRPIGQAIADQAAPLIGPGGQAFHGRVFDRGGIDGAPCGASFGARSALRGRCQRFVRQPR